MNRSILELIARVIGWFDTAARFWPQPPVCRDGAAGRVIVADDKLRRVFGKDQATMFEMNKPLAQHLA